jgi:hypothetical protein
MRSSLNFALWLALVVLGSQANAQAVTYDFTGVVTFSSGVYSSVAAGTAVSGTYTFDYSAGNVGGQVGDAAQLWSVSANGGSYFSQPTLQAFPFQTTAQVGAFSYSGGVPSAYLSSQSILGIPFSEFAASEAHQASATSLEYFSNLFLGGQFPYDANGLPLIPANASYAYASFGSIINSTTSQYVAFNLTSLTPAVPEPSSYALLIAGIGLVGLAAGRRRAN